MISKRRIRQRMDFRENTLYVGDCLDILKYWYSNQRLTGMIDLIYIDPPYNKNKNFNFIITPDDHQLQEAAFTDTWSLVKYNDCIDEIAKLGCINLVLFLDALIKSNVDTSYISYLANMGVRIIYMREMMKDTGSFYYHCDPKMSHYVKIMLDFIFGVKNYLNEIVWCYASPGKFTRYFPKKHDTIFLYSKTDSWTFNPDNLRIPYTPTGGGFQYRKWKEDGMTSEEQAKKKETFMERGKLVEDYWVDIPSLKRTSERLGYDTQKPEKLLERIILASSNPGDLVVDFFSGGGTTSAVAKRLNRKFITCDINLRAIELTSNRLNKIPKLPTHLISGIPGSSKQLQTYLNSTSTSSSNSGFKLEDLVIKVYLGLTVIKYGFSVLAQNKNNVGYDGEFTWYFDGKQRVGIIQVTQSHNFQHFSSFCHIVNLKKADLGVYITFEKNITPNMSEIIGTSRKIASKSSGSYNSIQILSIEDLIDNKKIFDVPFRVPTAIILPNEV